MRKKHRSTKATAIIVLIMLFGYALFGQTQIDTPQIPEKAAIATPPAGWNALGYKTGLGWIVKDSSGVESALMFQTNNPVFSGSVTTPIIKPAADSTTAVKITKANGTTAVVTVDTTNTRVGIGKTPETTFDVEGNVRTNGDNKGVYFNQGTLTDADSAKILYTPDGNLTFYARNGYDFNFARGDIILGGTFNSGTVDFPFLAGGTYLGYNAGANATGSSTYNTFAGYEAGTNVTTGYNNTFAGFQSGHEATEAFANSGFGIQTLQHLTTGSYNFAGGIHALLTTTIGVANNAIGAGSLQYLVDGSGNNAMGMYAGRDTLGDNGVFVGHHAGMDYDTDNCIYIGAFSEASGDGVDNEIAIGKGAVGNGSNTATIGNGDILRTYLTGVNLKAGTAAAGTAPLKFTAGTNLTTPEAGAVEYDGSNLFLTIAGPTRKTLMFTDDTAVDLDIASMTEQGSPASGMYLVVDDSGTRKKVNWSNLPGAAGGEVNTASNTGSSGFGLFKQKSTYDLEFYKILGSDGISFALNGTDYFDLKLNINSLSEESTPASGNYFVMYDPVSGTNKKVDVDNMPGSGGAGSDTTAIHDDTAGEINAISEKASPVSADLLIIEDSEDSNNKKKIQIGNLPSSGGTTLSYAIFEYVVASNSTGSSITTGDWRTVPLDTTEVNNISGASLSTSQITLPAGTYLLEPWMSLINITKYQLRLRNITDGTTIKASTLGFASGSVNASAAVSFAKYITLASSKVIEMQVVVYANVNYIYGPISLEDYVPAYIKITKIE